MAFDLKLTLPQRLMCGVLAKISAQEAEPAAQRLMRALGDKQAYAFAQDNGVLPIMAHALIAGANDRGVPEHWHQAHQES
jgi:hypothetical protein